MNNTILLVGGAGYIGSHTAYLLHKKNYEVIILDIFHHNQLINFPWATIIQGNYGDQPLLHKIFDTYEINAVMHFAAFIEVGLSTINPLIFYENNVSNIITLLSVMHQYHITKIIFSSSAAVYGLPHITPITEDHPKNPISPYGMSKLMVENILHDTHKAHALSYIALRYFNAAGALPSQQLGEQHAQETHVIPLLIQAALNNTPFYIFGTDYHTPDGTALRDYIHVLDIANAHINALEYLKTKNQSDCLNLGTENGVSVKEMIHKVERITNKKIPIINSPRREGDPAILIASSQKAQVSLNWKPHYSDIDTIIASAYEFALQKLQYNNTNTIHFTNLFDQF